MIAIARTSPMQTAETFKSVVNIPIAARATATTNAIT